LPEVDELPLVGALSEAGFATCGVSGLAKHLTDTAEPTCTIAELDLANDASKRMKSRTDGEEPMRPKLLTDSDSEPRRTTPSGPGAAAPKVRPRPPAPACGWACQERLRNSAMSPAASHAATSVLSLPEVDELPLVGALSEAGFATCGVSRLAKLLTLTAEPTRTIAELDLAIDASKRVKSRKDSAEPMRAKLLTDSASEPRSTPLSGLGAAAPNVRP